MKHWYTENCLSSRKNHKARKRYNMCKMTLTGNLYTSVCLVYSMLPFSLDFPFWLPFRYSLTFIFKRHEKDFWKILNSFLKKKDNNTDISLESLYEYLKKIKCWSSWFLCKYYNLSAEAEELLNSSYGISVSQLMITDMFHLS